MRHHHPGRPAIESGQDRAPSLRHAHDGSDIGGARGKARDVDGGRDRTCRMLLVDDDEVEAGLADDLDRVRGRNLDERAQHVPAMLRSCGGNRARGRACGMTAILRMMASLAANVAFQPA